MKKRYTIHIFILIAMIQACGKSFLDAPPGNILPREEVIANIDDCAKLLLGTYADFAASYGIYTDLYQELITDNVKPVAGVNNLTSAYTWNQLADDTKPTDMSSGATNMNAFSYRYYNLIRTSNFLIEKAEEFRQQNPSKSDYVIGSALTIRAYAYYQLVNMFAQPYNYSAQASHPGVVYATSSNWTDPITGRATVREVYNNIIADLERAIPLFHEETTTTLKYNRDLPTAILSRVLLTSENHTASLKYARDCISKYPLLTIENGYPDNVFTKTTPAESEAFFHLLPASSATLGYTGSALFSNRYYLRSTHFVATSDMVQLLTQNTGDVRQKWVTDAGTTGWKVTKFPIGTIPDIIPEEIANMQPIARVSEMYLNAAECFYHLQQEDSALHYLNQIIQRADIKATPISASGQQLLNLIKKERRKELSFEGFRLTDLQRWKQPIVRADDSQYPFLNLPNNKAIAPLPKQDINSIVIQNPGY